MQKGGRRSRKCRCGSRCAPRAIVFRSPRILRCDSEKGFAPTCERSDYCCSFVSATQIHSLIHSDTLRVVSVPPPPLTKCAPSSCRTFVARRPPHDYRVVAAPAYEASGTTAQHATDATRVSPYGSPISTTLFTSTISPPPRPLPLWLARSATPTATSTTTLEGTSTTESCFQRTYLAFQLAPWMLILPVRLVSFVARLLLLRMFELREQRFDDPTTFACFRLSSY